MKVWLRATWSPHGEWGAYDFSAFAMGALEPAFSGVATSGNRSRVYVVARRSCS